MSDNTARPVLIGVGQASRRPPAPLTSPQELLRAAATQALQDTYAPAAVAQAVDAVLVVRTMLDSVPGAPQPLGRCANPPGTLSADLGLKAAVQAYSVVGGDQPQALVAEAAERVTSGDARAVLIAGAEATASLKQALKGVDAPDWSRSVEATFEDRGLGPSLISPHELRHGWGAPVDTYPVFEHALRSRLDLSPADWRTRTARLWSRFSDVAATHRHAAFPQPRSPDFLGSESADNYRLADPYLKWDVAQDAVDQGAAVIVTSAGEAQALGVPASRWVYLHAHAAAVDAHVIDRADLSRSRIVDATLATAFARAGTGPDAVRHWDLYSCFPSVVLLAMEALGLAPDGPAPTVTGGLPFFGGPGNTYSLHAIATMVDRLRAEPDATGAVLANGGYLSKAAVGIYSARPGSPWRAEAIAPTGAGSPGLAAAPAEARLLAWSIGWTKGAPTRGWTLGECADGRRILGRVRSDDLARIADMFDQADPLGRPVRFAQDGDRTVLAI